MFLINFGRTNSQYRYAGHPTDLQEIMILWEFSKEMFFSLSEISLLFRFANITPTKLVAWACSAYKLIEINCRHA